MFFVNNQWVLVGLTSYGDGCAQAGYAGVYTRVSSFVTFIQSVTNSAGIIVGPTSTNNAKNQKNLLYESIFILIFCLLITINI